jgi:ERCC4-type nuclease
MPLTIVCDTREQCPWAFSPAVAVRVATVPTGADYTIEGFEADIGIERKSGPDLVGCLTHDRPRWERSLAALRTRRWHVVVVEAPLSWFMSAHYRSRVHPSAVLGSVCAIVADGTPVLFTAGPVEAAAVAERLLVKFHKRAVAAREVERAA